jgi:hypothetical protein
MSHPGCVVFAFMLLWCRIRHGSTTRDHMPRHLPNPSTPNPKPVCSSPPPLLHPPPHTHTTHLLLRQPQRLLQRPHRLLGVAQPRVGGAEAEEGALAVAWKGGRQGRCLLDAVVCSATPVCSADK